MNTKDYIGIVAILVVLGVLFSWKVPLLVLIGYAMLVLIGCSMVFFPSIVAFIETPTGLMITLGVSMVVSIVIACVARLITKRRGEPFFTANIGDFIAIYLGFK